MAATNLALIESFTDHADMIPLADRRLLQQQASQYLSGDVPELFHVKPVSPFGVVTVNRRQLLQHSVVRLHDATEAGSMSHTPKERFFTRNEHLARVGEAMRKRLYPNTPLHAKVLANAIGVTARTVLNWRYGRCDMGAWEFGRLCEFFEKVEGSALFRSEIFGDEIGIAMARRAALAHRVIAVAEELKAMEG